jgi:hypothetical protein
LIEKDEEGEVLDARGIARARAFEQSDIRVDWFRLLEQLRAEGYSLYAVAHFTSIPRSTLIGYKDGSQPPYHLGVCLLQFWSEATGRATSEAPTINRFSFKA